jgi:type IV pilus assembly protein PilA
LCASSQWHRSCFTVGQQRRHANHVGQQGSIHTKNRRGFTFIELVTVMVVMGVLCAMAVPRYRGYKARAYRGTMTSDLGNLRIAEEAYWAEHQAYATDTSALEFRGSSKVAVALSSIDPYAGYTAIATHRSLPNEQCATYAGKDAVGVNDGDIICGPSTSGISTVGSASP